MAIPGPSGLSGLSGLTGLTGGGALTGVSAYASLQAQAERAMKAAEMGAGGSAGAMPLGGSAVQGPGFGELLQQVMTEAVGASRHAEQAMAAQVQGQAELVDVVTAIAAAETSLETMMAVRDQVIAAYQEIMRMPI